MALAWNVEGVIVLGCKRQGYYTLREQLDVPIVTIDTCFQEGDQDFVNVGLCDYEGGKEMTSYLLQRGHRRIGFLPGGGEGSFRPAVYRQRALSRLPGRL